MLEQAVYAGRNHALSLAVVMLVLLSMAAPARAEDVARLPLGSEFGDLIAAPDGGAWVHVDRRTLSYTQGYGEPDDAIGRASADDRFVQTPVGRSLSGGVLGFDGQAWFAVGETLFRSDTAGTVSRRALSEPVGGSLTPGPDGTMWSPATIPQPVLQRIDAQGKVTSTPLSLPACERPAGFDEARTASDGAV